MNDLAFRLLLDFLMADDPSSLFKWTRDSLLWHADHEAKARGFPDWVAAYHDHTSTPAPPVRGNNMTEF